MVGEEGVLVLCYVNGLNYCPRALNGPLVAAMSAVTLALRLYQLQATDYHTKCCKCGAPVEGEVAAS